jgi:hypothetical protein
MTSKQNSSTEALDQYLKRTRTLLADIRKWSMDFGLCGSDGEITLNEERHGQYQAPTLILSDERAKRIAKLIPFGESIIGAQGRVDVVGDYGKQEKIIYLNEGGPTLSMRVQGSTEAIAVESARKLYRGVDAKGWYWISPSPIRRAYPITQEVFGDLLGAVTGHEFKS